MPAQLQLSKVIAALGRLRPAFRAAQGREEHGRQNSNDGDDDEKFDECETRGLKIPKSVLESRLNALVSGVALSFAVIPVIFTLSEEALRAVPRSYVEASIALGAARWQTIARVILPAARPRPPVGAGVVGLPYPGGVRGRRRDA